MGINVVTLLQETNQGSLRWKKAGDWVPESALPRNTLKQPKHGSGNLGGGLSDGAHAIAHPPSTAKTLEPHVPNVPASLTVTNPLS